MVHVVHVLYIVVPCTFFVLYIVVLVLVSELVLNKTEHFPKLVLYSCTLGIKNMRKIRIFYLLEVTRFINLLCRLGGGGCSRFEYENNIFREKKLI